MEQSQDELPSNRAIIFVVVSSMILLLVIVIFIVDDTPIDNVKAATIGECSTTITINQLEQKGKGAGIALRAKSETEWQILIPDIGCPLGTRWVDYARTWPESSANRLICSHNGIIWWKARDDGICYAEDEPHNKWTIDKPCLYDLCKENGEPAK